MSSSETSWQFVHATPTTEMQRVSVPGGWIYRDLITSYDGKILSTAICFVPMPPPAPAR